MKRDSQNPAPGNQSLQSECPLVQGPPRQRTGDRKTGRRRISDTLQKKRWGQTEITGSHLLLKLIHHAGFGHNCSVVTPVNGSRFLWQGCKSASKQFSTNL